MRAAEGLMRRKANIDRAIGLLARISVEKRLCLGDPTVRRIVRSPRPLNASQQGRRLMSLLRREARVGLYLYGQLHPELARRVAQGLAVN